MEKYVSRKFILAVLSAIGGAAISLSQLEGKVGIIAAVISAIVPAVTYIITEGVVDAKAVGLLCSAVEDVAEVIEGDDGETESAKG